MCRPRRQPHDHGYGMDVDAGAVAAYADVLGEATRRDHPKACGVEVEGGDGGGPPSALGLRERLERHLSSVARVTKKPKAAHAH
eukprot:1084922-Pyramimonas_sp.AAC.1